MPRRLSFQLYSARTGGPLNRVLPALAALGYREVEGYGGLYDDPAKLKRLLDRSSLSMPTGHFGLDLLEGDPQGALAIARTLGMRQIFAPWLPEDQRPKSATGWRRLATRLAAVGTWARGEGLGFGWHNHDFEFLPLPSGEIPMAILLDEAPFIDWECDVAWVARSGADPLKWIRSHGGRITAVHVKDIARKGEGADEDGWADVGYGKLDWARLLAALKASRTLHYVMEHDNPSDLMRFARRSFDTVSRI